MGCRDKEDKVRKQQGLPLCLAVQSFGCHMKYFCERRVCEMKYPNPDETQIVPARQYDPPDVLRRLVAAI